jgi:hypothetical protein
MITESLDYEDMKGQIDPILSIDEYQAKMGPDSDIVTLSFVVNSKLVAEDLTSWFEKGYDFVLDASVSTGEIAPRKHVVFLELERRTSIPRRIVQLLTDLETLSGIKVSGWKVKIDEDEYPVDEQIIKDRVILNPNRYKIEKEKKDELNEYLTIAGLDEQKIYNKDKEITDFVSLAGL